MSEALTSVLIGGVIATVSSMLTLMVTHHLENRRMRRSVAAAIAGEVQGIVEIMRYRGYANDVDELLDRIEKNQKVTIFRLRITQDYFEVFRAHCGNLGLLPPALSIDVVLFYTFAKSLLEDVTNADLDPETYQEATGLLQSFKSLLEQLDKRGTSLVERLTTVAKPLR